MHHAGAVLRFRSQVSALVRFRDVITTGNLSVDVIIFEEATKMDEPEGNATVLFSLNFSNKCSFSSFIKDESLEALSISYSDCNVA